MSFTLTNFCQGSLPFLSKMGAVLLNRTGILKLAALIMSNKAMFVTQNI